MKNTFFGGVFPPLHKENSRRKPVSPMDQPPAQVVIPLEMSKEGPAVALVHPGDKVCLRQVIAAIPDGSYVHASVSGTVLAVEPRPHPWGGNRPAIVIQNDLMDTTDGHVMPPLAPNMVNLEVLVDRVRRAGIVGMGGGAYPTWLKLKQAAGQVDTLIVNAAESEPYVTADYRLMMERSDRILQGAQTIGRCLGAKRTVVVTAGDKIKAVEIIERRLRRRKGLELVTVRARYPLGAERQIVQTVTGRETPAGRPVLDSKCVVLNVATVFAVQEALSGAPLTHRVVTVTGGAVSRPRNLLVPIGTPLQDVLREAGECKNADLMLTGGPMMGSEQTDLSVPVIKDTNALLCMTARERRQEHEAGICIRCGKCVASCPMHLAPTLVTRALRKKEYHKLSSFHVEDCMGCGSCSYVCPAHIPLKVRMQTALEIVKGGRNDGE